MTTTERRQNELAELISAHLVIRCDIQSASIRCTARVDLPMHGIRAGEVFWLVASSYTGYAYIVADGVSGLACSCFGYSFKHTCKHVRLVSDANAARYFREQEPVLGHAFAADLPVHVEDELAIGTCATCSNAVKPGFVYCPKCSGAAAA
jgi:hypothetical protein